MCFSLSMYEGLRLDVRLVSLSVTTTRVVGLWQERSDLFSFWNTRQFKLFRSIYTWLCVVGDIRWQTKLKKTWNPKWSTIFLRQLNRASTYVSRFRGWVEDLSFPPSSHPPPPPHPPTTTNLLVTSRRAREHLLSLGGPFSTLCFPFNLQPCDSHGRRGPNIGVKNSHHSSTRWTTVVFVILNTDCELVYKVIVPQSTALNP